MNQNHLNNFGRVPPKDLCVKLFKNWARGLRGVITDGRTKNDHKSSPCHFVTGELKSQICLLKPGDC